MRSVFYGTCIFWNMKFIFTLLVIFLPFLRPTIELTNTRCPIGQPLVSAKNNSLVECYKLSKHRRCPSPYYCSGGVLSKGVCCKDSLSLLCLTCFKAVDVKWTTDDTGTIFHVNIFFRWEREECSKSVVHHGWDPSLTVLVIGDDNQTWLERTLNCKATEKPCSKYFTFNIPLKSYRVLYQVNGPGMSSLCRFIEIVKVSPPLSPPSLALPKPVQDNTAQPPLSSSVETIASILVALCLLAIATAVVFVYRWRFGQSVKNNHHESEIALVQENVDIFTVAMPGIGAEVIKELKQISSLHFITVDQFQAEIFQNSKEWMDSVQHKYTNFLFLLTKELICDDVEDFSHPLNSIAKSLFHNIQNSPRVENLNTFYVYLQQPSSFKSHFPNSRHKRNDIYNFSGKNFHNKDFHRLVSDLKAIHSNV